MEKRRKYERFDLRLPGKIEVLTSGKQKTLDLVTSDVSAGGGFFYAGEPIPQGAQVKIRIILASEGLKELTGAQGLLKVAGTVMRCNAKGMAVSFDGDYQIVSLPSV